MNLLLCCLVFSTAMMPKPVPCYGFTIRTIPVTRNGDRGSRMYGSRISGYQLTSWLATHKAGNTGTGMREISRTTQPCGTLQGVSTVICR